jgi:hypothetical protein
MSKGQATIGIVGSLGIITTFLVGWNSWNSIKTITVGEQTAAILEWQKNTKEDLIKYQTEQTKKTDAIAEDVESLNIKTAVTNEIVKQLGERMQINSAAVEARVIRDVERIEKKANSTTTAFKKI